VPLQASPAVLRALEVLEELARAPARPVNASELARAIGIPRATCHSVLLALVERGYVVRNQDLRYRLGPAAIVVGDAARSGMTILRETATEAERLAYETSSCVAVLAGENDEIRAVEVFDFAPPLGLKARVGYAVPLVAPFGTAFAAWRSESDIKRWLANARRELSGLEVERCRAALVSVRQRGFSITVEVDRRAALADVLGSLMSAPGDQGARRRRDELIAEITLNEYLPVTVDEDVALRVSQLTAPVFDTNGGVAAVITLCGATYEIAGSEINQLGAQLVEAASRATRRAGGELRTAQDSARAPAARIS
jgi:DNA-binding IclR family transcriptional regulator